MIKRAFVPNKRGYRGLDPLYRRAADKWGFLSRDVVSNAAARPVWVNMYAGGDVLVAWGLLGRMKADKAPLVMSTEAYDGHALLGRTFGVNRVFFSPWDIALPASRHLDGVRPRALVCVPHMYCVALLRLARRKGVRTILANGRLSGPVAHGNTPLQRALALGVVHALDAIAVQCEEDYQAFRRLGVPATALAVTGDLASDLGHVALDGNEREALRSDLGLGPGDPVVIVGSGHPGEAQLIADAFAALRRSLGHVRLIVAPRLLHELHTVAAPFERYGFRLARRTTLEAQRQPAEYDVLLLDTFGELRRIYGVADVAFIGSTIVPINVRGGGHNPLEILAHGVVPVFGPHMSLWRRVTTRLLEVEPRLQVESAETLARRLGDILDGTVPAKPVQEAGRELVAEAGGALEATVAFLDSVLP
jgi:3-deoxy-D-manno-octulosonic-acid transferase